MVLRWKDVGKNFDTSHSTTKNEPSADEKQSLI